MCACVRACVRAYLLARVCARVWACTCACAWEGSSWADCADCADCADLPGRAKEFTSSHSAEEGGGVAACSETCSRTLCTRHAHLRESTRPAATALRLRASRPPVGGSLVAGCRAAPPRPPLTSSTPGQPRHRRAASAACGQARSRAARGAGERTPDGRACRCQGGRVATAWYRIEPGVVRLGVSSTTDMWRPSAGMDAPREGYRRHRSASVPHVLAGRSRALLNPPHTKPKLLLERSKARRPRGKLPLHSGGGRVVRPI